MDDSIVKADIKELTGGINNDKLKVLLDRVKYLENYDAITGLPNRALFIRKVSDTILLQSNGAKNNALLTVDLDNFKKLSDAYGYLVSDELLKIAAFKLKSCVRGNDFVARIGGDEFFVLLEGFEDFEHIKRISERILSVFNDIWKIYNHEFYMTASIGIAIIPGDKADVSDIMMNATSALYGAKSKGKNQYKFHETGINEKLIDMYKLENSLRCAVERDEIVVHYQPQVDAETGRITGMEALARWQHPELGLIPPSQFIDIAENSGLIIPIGSKVIELVCEQNMKWKRSGYGTFHVAVNVSSRQLQQSGFVSFIKKVLNKTGMPPSCLEIEITESAIVKSMNSAIYVLNQLRELGIKISLDDFGTGYSSLSYLKTLPVDKIKIDRSFVVDIGINRKTESIISGIILLAKVMGLGMLAEGVETPEQSIFLIQNGCPNIQGFLYSKPLPEEQIRELLSDKNLRSDKISWFYYILSDLTLF